MESMREKQRLEALIWMDIMDVPRGIIHLFRGSGMISLCDGECGDYAPIEKSMQDEARAFEREYDATVFLILRKRFIFGLLDSFLYVGDDEDQWPGLRDDLEKGYADAYTINRSIPGCWNVGGIVFRKDEFGGVIRIY